MLFNVPGCKIGAEFAGNGDPALLDLRPFLILCVNWRWLPFAAAWVHPSSSGRRMISLTIVGTGHEHPVVEPHVSHFRHVPLRTMVKLPHSPQASPSLCPAFEAISFSCVLPG